MNKEIGGYFSLQLDNTKQGFLHSELYLVNSGRNAFELILSSIEKVKKVWIPYYTCEVVLEPLQKLEIPYSFYSIDRDLEISDEIVLGTDEYLLYTNYFGIKTAYAQSLEKRYGERLIIDNSQAFYAEPPISSYAFYSPRKFVGLPDGGMASIPSVNVDMNAFDLDVSNDRCSHLLLRVEEKASKGYSSFKENSRKIVDQPIKRMSCITKMLLSNIDFNRTGEIRKRNFNQLHQELGNRNRLKIGELTDLDIPMVYPFWTEDCDLRKRLIENKIYVATYWPNVLEWCSEQDIEYKLAKEIIPLPIDQRYGREEMEWIIKNIKNEV